MSPDPQTPDFSSLEISSIKARKVFDRGFLILCVTTSMISIVILAILLSSIAIKAVATFGPHEDKLETETRWLVSQGTNEGNDPDRIDQGDHLQAIFSVGLLDRGGLGKTNDTEYGQQEHLIGICAYEVGSPQEEDTYHLVPARGERNAVELARQIGAIPEQSWCEDFQKPNPSNPAAFVLLKNASTEFDFSKIQTGGTLLEEGKLVGAIGKDSGWSVVLIGGLQEDNFSMLDMKAVKSEMAAVKKLRGPRNRAGKFQGLCSILAHDLGEQVKFKQVKMRQFGSDEISKGDIKFDNSKLAGISRRKRNGFMLSDKFELKYCPIPETHASTAGHVKHFLTETNKNEPSEIGIGPALTGTIWVCLGCALFALPLGIGTAILLEEFQPTHPVIRALHGLVQINITNLAGVPSIVYGILGLTAFAGMFGLFGIAKEPYVEIGADHYFQYLSESNKSVLIPVSPEKRAMARQLEQVRKRQKRIFQTTFQGIEHPLNLSASVPTIHDSFKQKLQSYESRFDDEEGLAAYQKSIAAMDNVIAELKKPFEQEALLEVSRQSEVALRELISVAQKPQLVHGMTTFTGDFVEQKLIVLEPGDELPTTDEELSRTLRSESVGGPISKKHWYYFQLPFGRSVLAASLTLMLVILPVIIIASQEALRAVPPSLRECALGLGSTPWQVVRNVTLPAAIPSIMTGAILSMSRAIGEAAPILIICGILFVTAGPSNLMDVFSILPIQIYDTTKLPVDQEEMINSQNVAAAGIVVLLAILLTFNAVAVTIRQWTQKPLT